MLLICIGLEAEYIFWRESLKNRGIDTVQLIQEKMDEPEELSKLREHLTTRKRTVILYQCHGECRNLPGWLENLGDAVIRIPIGSEALLYGCENARGMEIEKLNQYILYGGDENLKNAGLFLRKTFFFENLKEEVGEPVELAFDGIMTEESSRVYKSLKEYLDCCERKYDCYVGMMVHRNYWIRDDLESFWILKKELEKHDIGTICVFSQGTSQGRNFRQLVDTYWSIEGKLQIKALVMAQMLPVTPENGLSIAKQSVLEFKHLGIPIFRPVQSYYLTTTQWEQKTQPMIEDLTSGFMIPEMAGMTEPVLISTRDRESNRTVPIPEQIQWLAGRILSWLNLQKKSNKEKKIVLMLHNAVCSGVEATIGKAYGLDALQSAVEIMNCLKKEGYAVENIPKDGKALLELIREKKAYSDFRWTAVEDIVDSGGCLYRMSCEEYGTYYEELSREQQAYMEETWGGLPGEGMVLENDLIITGLSFGNILLMIQPKRGCYGAKCTGEVCKILHDPLCPPTHQYLASYRYLERVFKADACVDIGTEGSVEFLPGKVNALSKNCWPRITLETMPVIYLYHAGVPGEGTVAKRRAHAVTVTYLPFAMRGLNEQEKKLLKKLEEYTKAVDTDNGQDEMLRKELEILISEIPAAKKIMDNTENFSQGVRELSDAAALMNGSAKGNVRHIFGVNPNEEEMDGYVAEAKEFDPKEIRTFLEKTSEEELCGLTEALSGRYVPASESGMPDENGREILPTGRNLFGLKEKDFPGKIPYRRGMELAVQLLADYLKDEGSYPEKVALNMISIDITRTGGEQLSEFLYLMGIRPVWDDKERVKGLEVIPAAELGRPRIDVTVRISGVLRDTWPMAVRLMDEAVLLASSLEESVEENYVKKHVLEYQNDYGDHLEREKTIRIFGDPPGGYGAGVDLALKASAWKEEKDLAKYNMQSSAFAYGKELDGEKKLREFADNMKKVQVISDVIQSKRNDLLSCGFSLNVQGGMALTSKYLGGRKVRHYYASSEKDKPVRTETLSEALEKTIKETLLNPFWQEMEKTNDYDGASEMMAHIQHVFEAQCLMECVDDKVLDELTDAYVNDDEMRKWLLAKNPYAAEEISRRMLELVQREKWHPNPEVLRNLKENYLEIEGDMEEGLESKGDIQGGSVDIINHDEVESWQDKLKEIDEWMK